MKVSRFDPKKKSYVHKKPSERSNQSKEFLISSHNKFHDSMIPDYKKGPKKPHSGRAS